MLKIGIVVVCVVGALAAFGGYWWAKDHQRIGESSLEGKVADSQLANSVACAKKSGNGSVWWCVGSVQGTQKCWVVHVRLMGSVKYKDGGGRCKTDTTLTPAAATS